MANDIVNLPNSFIIWCNEAADTCNDYNGVVLPIHDINDIQCMLKVETTDTDYLDGLSFYLLRGDYDIGEAITATDIVFTYSFQYASLGGGDYAVVLLDESCTAGDLAATTYGATENECLTLVVSRTGAGTVLCKSLQRFRYVSDTCFTNVIRYGCADNAFGFYYEEVNTTIGTSYYNQIRIPITLHSPRPVTEKSGFRKSDGRFMTLSATKSKEWEVETDYLSDYLHQCIDAAIDHDTVYIFEAIVSGCDYTGSEYYRDEADKYDIQWDEQPGRHLGVAKAKTKLRTNPYYSNNNNC